MTVKRDTLQVKGRKEHVEEKSERRRRWMRMNKAEEDGKNGGKCKREYEDKRGEEKKVIRK